MTQPEIFSYSCLAAIVFLSWLVLSAKRKEKSTKPPVPSGAAPTSLGYGFKETGRMLKGMIAGYGRLQMVAISIGTYEVWVVNLKTGAKQELRLRVNASLVDDWDICWTIMFSGQNQGVGSVTQYYIGDFSEMLADLEEHLLKPQFATDPSVGGERGLVLVEPTPARELYCSKLEHLEKVGR